MAMRGSRGLKYFPLVTDFFQDRDIRRLMFSHGDCGVLLFMYILCAIYAKSYFLQWNEDMLFDAALDLRRDAGELNGMLDYLLDKGFFDRELFEKKGVLSSRAVQRQFQECARVMKRKVNVDAELWLLDESETLACITVQNEVVIPENSGKTDENSGKIGENSGKTAHNSGISPQKKIKENKKKLNESGESKEAPEQAASGADKAEDIVTTYRKKLYLSGKEAAELRDYCALLGYELCSHALERAEEMDRLQWNYVRSILRRYKQNGFTRMEQVFEEERRHKSQYGRSPPMAAVERSQEEIDRLMKDLEKDLR